MTLLKVDGVALKSPTSYDLKLADIDSAKSGRVESGLMTREVVRRKVATLNVGFENISTAEHQRIIQAVNKDFVTVEYYDGTPDLKTVTMYTSELDFKLVSVENDMWTVTFQLTQQ